MKLILSLTPRVRIYSDVMVTNLQGEGFLVRAICLGPCWNLLERDGGCQKVMLLTKKGGRVCWMLRESP